MCWTDQQFGLQGNTEKENGVMEGWWSQREKSGGRAWSWPSRNPCTSCHQHAQRQLGSRHLTALTNKNQTHGEKKKNSGLHTDCGCHYSNRDGYGKRVLTFSEQGWFQRLRQLEINKKSKSDTSSRKWGSSICDHMTLLPCHALKQRILH